MAATTGNFRLGPDAGRVVIKTGRAGLAAKQLGVSVKTVSRWVGGATEPRLRDLRRIRELFGDFPLP